MLCGLWVNSDPRSCSALQLIRCPEFRWPKCSSVGGSRRRLASIPARGARCVVLLVVFCLSCSPLAVEDKPDLRAVTCVMSLIYRIVYSIFYFYFRYFRIMINGHDRAQFHYKNICKYKHRQTFPVTCTIGPIQPLKALRSSGTLLPRPARYLRTSRVNGRGFGNNPSLWNLNRISSTG